MDAEALVVRWQGPMYAYARRIVRNDADAADLAQEILLTVLRGRERYDPSRPLDPWVWRIATNVVYRHLRDGKLRREREGEAARMHEQRRPTARDPHADAEHAEACRAVETALEALPDEQRVLLVTHCVHGQSLGEIATAAGLSKSTVQSRVERAIVALRKGLREAPAATALLDDDDRARAFLATLPAIEPPAGLRETVLRDAPREGEPAGPPTPLAPSEGRSWRTGWIAAAGVAVGLAAGLVLRGGGSPAGGTGDTPSRATANAAAGPREPGLARVVLAATHPAACARFYTALLEIPFEAKPMGPAQFFDGRFGTLAIRIFPAEIAGITAKDNRHQLGFLVKDLRAALARGMAAGGTMDAGWAVEETPGGLTVALRDPDGNSIELFQAK